MPAVPRQSLSVRAVTDTLNPLPQVHSSQNADVLTGGKLTKQILRRRIFMMALDPVYLKMF